MDPHLTVEKFRRSLTIRSHDLNMDIEMHDTEILDMETAASKENQLRAFSARKELL